MRLSPTSGRFSSSPSTPACVVVRSSISDGPRLTSGAGSCMLSRPRRAKNRIVPMNKTLYETLKALRAEASGSDKVYAWKHVQKAYEKARTNAKLDGLRLHDLRHTFATRLIQPASTSSRCRGF